MNAFFKGPLWLSLLIVIVAAPAWATVSFTSVTPAGGSTISQNSNLTGTTNTAVQVIQIIIDGNLYAASTNSMPTSFTTTAASISVGKHTLIAKAWYNNGSSVLSNNGVPQNITVQGSTVGGSAFDIPSGAWTSDALDQCPLNTPNGTCGNSYWQEWADVNSNGTASESFSHVTENGFLSAMFGFTHKNYGDILNHLSTAYVNTSGTNFVYDVWVQAQYVSTPSKPNGSLQVLEFGVNHAIASGRVLFPGVQCNFAGDAHWDVNGFGSNPWTESSVPCLGSNWQMTWHHVKLALSVYYGANASEDRSYVNALYDGTIVNGVEKGTTYTINMDGGTQNFAYQPGLVTAKFQIGGASGTQSSNVWISNLLISAW